MFYHSTDKEINFQKYYMFNFVRTGFILSCELVRNMMELSSTRFFFCSIAVLHTRISSAILVAENGFLSPNESALLSH